ncbi:MAG: hypothetical protein N2560_03985 [Ignavibacteria bacterium]|nr:hypothetical protein [Ignavibacteria bacterium]
MEKDINPIEITNFLEVEPEKTFNCWTWKLYDKENKSFLFLSLYTDIEFDGKKNRLVSVQTNFGYFELHNFSHVLFLEPNEISFVEFSKEKINCLIVGKNCTCSLYSNINRDIVKTNIAELDPAFLLSALQLALLEDTLA